MSRSALAALVFALSVTRLGAGPLEQQLGLPEWSSDEAFDIEKLSRWRTHSN